MTYDLKQPFDVNECMPAEGLIADYITYAGLRATNSTRIYHLGALLPILFNELNLRGYYLAELCDSSGKKKPFTVYSLLLGRSADGKTTSATVAIDHITELFQQLEDEQQTARNKRVLKFEGTPEGLRYALATEHYNLDTDSTVALLYNDEFTILFQKARSTIAEMILQLYDGNNLEEHLRQHQKAADDGAYTSATIKNPKVNGLFCSTPDNLAAVVGKTLMSGGLYGRLLVFTGEKRVVPYEGDITGNEEWRTLREQWREASQESLMAWAQFLEDTRDSSGGAITISEKAHIVYRRWHEQWQQRLSETEIDDNLRAMLGRAIRLGWMIGGLYATTAHRMQVSDVDARLAMKLIDHCFAMGSMLNDSFDATEQQKRLDALVDALQTAGSRGLNMSELYHIPGIRNKGISGSEMQVLLQSLEERGILIRRRKKLEGARGRPAIRCFAAGFEPSDPAAN